MLALIAGNLALVMIGGAFFSNILPPYAAAHTPVSPVGIGVVVFINTFFIVVAQIPATRVVARMRRTHALFATSPAFRSRPARGPARNAHALDARRYGRPGRRRDPDRDRCSVASSSCSAR